MEKRATFINVKRSKQEEDKKGRDRTALVVYQNQIEALINELQNCSGHAILDIRINTQFDIKSKAKKDYGFIIVSNMELEDTKPAKGKFVPKSTFQRNNG